MDNLSINVQNVSMEYRKTTEKVDTLKELIIRKIKRNVEYASFLALDNVSFQIAKGEKIGIIGHNGAGKSTIMKIVANVLKPTHGTVEVNGIVAPMLELGAGFDIEFSGYDNIFLNGAILGKSKEYLEENLQRIIDFADIGEFIYSPVKNYSSGMRAKLGFAICTQIEPDILIVDEILGVGDSNFRKKSTNKMKELIHSGATSIIVSHNLNDINDLTEKTMWLDHGKIVMFDETAKVCDAYSEFMENLSKEKQKPNKE